VVVASCAVPVATAVEPRTRILDAMARLVSEKGYAAVTIDDVARRARISKRTFYDHFADKERCFLAAYEAAADHVYDRVEEAAAPAPGRSWRDRLDAVLTTYLKAMAAEPEKTRVFHVEIQAAGPEALELHLGVNRRYAALLQRIVREGGEARLRPTVAIALLGGVHELVLHAVADGTTRRLAAQVSVLRPLLEAAVAHRH
jgi:AcrR family transcriptional regulator